MSNEIGTAYVGVEFDKSGVGKQLGGLQSDLQSQLGPLGSILGTSLKAGLVGAAAGAAVLVGKYLYDIGSQFDDMADTIATATGKSGDDLDGLVDIAKDVGKTVPISFEDAGTAVAQLASKTGMTGKPLKSLATQVTALSKVTGQELGQTIESSTRLLGDWGLKGEQASEGLDTLYKASQATGTETTRLAELLTKFGGPFRQLGFSFEDSAALLGKWQKEGVNTELVAGSMRIALGKFAKAGREPAEALQETITAIQNAGSAGEANQKAIEAFGARAGPDMAAAIREGRFEIDDLVKTMQSSQSTILNSEKGTRDFAEQWLLFKNQVAVALAPIAERLFAAIGEGMAAINEYGPPAVKFLVDNFGPAFEAIAELVRELEPVFSVAFKAIAIILRGFIGDLKAVLEIVTNVVRLISALLRGDWAAAWDAAKGIVDGFVDFFRNRLNTILQLLQLFLSPLVQAATAIGTGIKNGIMGVVNTIDEAVRAAFSATLTVIRGVVEAARAAATAVGTAIKTGIVAVVSTVDDAIRAAFNAALNLLRGLVDDARAVGERIGSAIWNGVKTGVAAVAGVGPAVASQIRGAVGDAVAAASSFGSSVGSAIYRGILDALSGIGDAIRRLIPSPGDLVGAIKGAIPGLRMAPGGGGGGTAPAPVTATAQAGMLGASGGAGGGLAGPVPYGAQVRRALSSIQTPTAGGGGGLEVRVYIGDTELRGIVRTEVVDSNTGLARALLAGGRA
jgi:TP901 family phage tail tape measure protein